jgi:tetratricopeptide (TPR) repeat protein
MTGIFLLFLLFLLQAPPAPPPAVASIAREAEAAREADRLDDAVALYRKGVAIAPRWAEGWWYLGAIHYDRDRYPLCRDAFRRFIVLDPQNAPALAMLGLCEFQTKEFPASLEHLEKSFSTGLPNDSQLTNVVLYHIALLQNRAGYFERAIQITRLLCRKMPDPSKLIVVAGVAGMRKPIFPQELPEADRDLAIKLGQAVLAPDLKPVDQWQKDFDDLIAAYPNTPNVHYAYATILLANDPDRGLAELLRELEISPDHLPALVSAVFEYLKRGDAQAAKPFAERAAKVAPGNFTARASLGRVLTETNDLPRAIQELETAAKLAPDSPQLRLWLAQAYSKAGRKADAARERAEFARLKKITTAGNSQEVR